MASEHTTVSKLGLLLGPFKLKFTGELFVMTMKNDAKFEIEVTYQFKIYMRNLTILTGAFQNLKN